MNRIRIFRKNKDITKKKINKIKSGTLKLSLIMLNFVFATFAWFTYTKILHPAVDVNVSAWQVDFKDSDGLLGTSMQFSVGNFYPGMADYTKQIEIENLGDREASIDYEIKELKLLGQEYIIKETQEEGDTEFTLYKSVETVYKKDAGGNIIKDSEENPIIDKYIIKLLNDSTKYPFEIKVTHTAQVDIKDLLDETKNKGIFEICFTWPYEVIVDEGETPTEEQIEQKNTLDTKWGYDIANFYENLPEGDTTQGNEITLQAIARQVI